MHIYNSSIHQLRSVLKVLDLSTVDRVPEVLRDKSAKPNFAIEKMIELLKTENPQAIVRRIFINRSAFFSDDVFETKTDKKTSDPLRDELSLALRIEQSLMLPMVNRFDVKQSKFYEIQQENEIFYTLISCLELAIRNGKDISKLLCDHGQFIKFIMDKKNWKELLQINPNIGKISFYDFNLLDSDSAFKILLPNKTRSKSNSVLFRVVMLVWIIDPVILANINSRDVFNHVGEEVGYKQYEAFKEAFDEIKKALCIKARAGRPKK